LSARRIVCGKCLDIAACVEVSELEAGWRILAGKESREKAQQN